LKKRLSKSLYTDRWEQLLKILKRLRVEKGLTQVQLAAQLDRPQSLIAKIESGERKLDVCQFLDYMEALDASAEDVIREMGQSLKD
jgi:transcriptional regulator with XRE-family HTH domain